MMGDPRLETQFGVCKVVSTNHLMILLSGLNNDFFVPVGSLRTKIIVARGGDGLITVHHPDGHCDRIAPEHLRATYLAGWISEGRLFYQAA